MRFDRLIAGCMIMTIFGCGRASPQLTASDVAEIKAGYDKWAQAVVRADIDALAKLVTADNWNSQPNQAPLVGRDAVVAWARTWPKTLSLAFVVDEVGGEGDIAYARVSGTEVYVLHDGSSATDHFVCLDILRRRTDRSWELSRDMCHSTDPLYRRR